jgi:hypothetical protein
MLVAISVLALASATMPPSGKVGTWELVLEDVLQRREQGAVCLVVRVDGKDVAPSADLVAALHRKHPDMQAYPDCGDARRLWVQEGQGAVLVGDGFCECRYRVRRKWLRRRVIGGCLCE